ncbi:sulfur carrier protein ThiS [Geoalkalibacter sp.]|uniref:sulfur carrier protein ThiS n=1 Tax=Geoalkalibacter sp. TaxID=3041440 RepID=UPI00272DE8DC|nr:sulfur carrier protein ThiS [Geoalkalibacter sp.]
MQVKINGELRELAAPLTVAAYLESLGLEPERVVIEHNHAILSRADFAKAPLGDGDQLEIIQFVGGG